ncbi:hypothetical protein ACOQFB_09685 [Anaeromyxobacter sp. Red801]|uniref:hypothetical protein n=1 Tax=Anaeromyxobacter sp. Red801 TaxID=3411632 RepID=UPI003BA1ECC3
MPGALALVLSAALAAAPAASAPGKQRPRRPARAAPASAAPVPRPPAAAEDGPPAPARRADRPRGTGQITYATASRAYLDAGSDDGLAAGAVIELRRNGAPAGRCTVESLAPHHAACAGTGLRPGDAFRFEPAALAAEARPLPPPPGDAELARRLAVVTAAPVPQVEFRAAPGAASAPVPRSRTAEVGASYQAWTASTAGTSDRAALDVAIREAELAPWLTLDVDARAERWLRRDAPRFRPKDDTQLYLWQAQLTATPGDALRLSAGRVLPWAIPGATVFDGGLAGVRGRLLGARAEGGVFGGAVPEPDTTEPTTRRATGGAYWILDGALGRGASWRQEGRIAMVRTPELGTRAEGSLTGRVFLRRLDLSAEAHVGGGGKRGGTDLDAARVDASARPVDGLLVGGSFRHAGLAWPQTFDPAAFPGRSRAADGFVSWDPVRWLRVGGTGGFSRDVSSGLERRWAGPELGLPRLLGASGGLTLGYLEESGWLDGRSAYAQLLWRPFQALRLVGRASWSHDAAFGVDRDEIGVLASATADLGRHLGLRISLAGRGAFDPGAEEGGSMPYGMTGFATIFAAY